MSFLRVSPSGTSCDIKKKLKKIVWGLNIAIPIVNARRNSNIVSET